MLKYDDFKKCTFYKSHVTNTLVVWKKTIRNEYWKRIESSNEWFGIMPE